MRKAVVKQMSPRIIGDEANKSAAVNDKISEAKRGWVIYGEWGYHFCWCQRPVCANYTTPYKRGLFRVFFCVEG